MGLGLIISCNSVSRTVEIRPYASIGIITAALAEHIATTDCSLNSTAAYLGTPDSGYMLVGVIKA